MNLDFDKELASAEENLLSFGLQPITIEALRRLKRLRELVREGKIMIVRPARDDVPCEALDLLNIKET